MKTIIAATDFSLASTNAANYAADMAANIRARLTLFHVHKLPLLTGDMPLPLNAIQELEAEAEQQLYDLKERLLHRTGDRIIIHIELRSGDVISELLNYSTTVRPYTIVMGIESGSGFERLLAGSTANTAMQRLRWPVMLIPPTAQFKDIRRIGLACDFHDVVESIRLQHVAKLVEEFEAELHVLHVLEEPRAVHAAKPQEFPLVQKLLGGLNPKYHFSSDAMIEQGINDLVQKQKIDVLIVIPKKHNLISKIFRYSQSKHLMLHTLVPIVSIHQ